MLAAAVAVGLLQAVIRYAGDGAAESMRPWQLRMVWVIGINVLIAAGYTVFPKKPPRIPAGPPERRTRVKS